MEHPRIDRETMSFSFFSFSNEKEKEKVPMTLKDAETKRPE